MSEDSVPYHPDGLSPPPAKPAQPSIADLYAEIAALRKANDALQQALDAALNRAKIEAFDLKRPTISDHNAVLIAKSECGITVRADRHGWVATNSRGLPLSVVRDASPHSNFQAAVAKLARAGILLGEPTLESACNPTTTPIPTPA